MDCYNNILLLLFYDYNTLKSHCQAENFFQNDLLHNSQSFDKIFGYYALASEQNVVTKQKISPVFQPKLGILCKRSPYAIIAHMGSLHIYFTFIELLKYLRALLGPVLI